MIKELTAGIKKQRNVLKIIGVIEILGGFVGIALIFWLISRGVQVNLSLFIVLLLALTFYAYSIFAGIVLYKKCEKGIFHSWIVQLIQIIGFSYGGVTYTLTSGANFLIGYNFTEGNLNFNLGLASEFDLSMTTEINNFIQINLIAILFLYLLEKSVKVINEKEEMLTNWKKTS